MLYLYQTNLGNWTSTYIDHLDNLYYVLAEYLFRCSHAMNATVSAKAETWRKSCIILGSV